MAKLINFYLNNDVEKHLAAIKEFLKNTSALTTTDCGTFVDVYIESEDVYGYVTKNKNGYVLRIFGATSHNYIEIPLDDIDTVFTL